MTKTGLFARIRRMRILVVLLALLFTYGTINYSLKAANPIQVYSVSLGGVTGATNNTALAYGRYVLIAPYWPSKGVDANGDLDLAQLDNRFLYAIDTKKPNSDPLVAELASPASQTGNKKTVYFPTKVLFDSASSTVYIRGTRFEETEDGVTAIDVIAYVHMNLDDKGKPVFDTNVVPIDIAGVSGGYASDAPANFALSSGGDYLIFTNGASVFSYDVSQGYLNEMSIIPAKDYGSNYTISFLDVDSATNIVSVSWDRKIADDDASRTVSELSFYELGKGGTFSLVKHVSSDQFPKLTTLSPGSNIAIVSDDNSEAAVLIGSDGSLYSIDLTGDDTIGALKQLCSFSILASAKGAATSHLLVQYDSATRAIGIVRPGYIIQISRPINGKKGRISRPINVTSADPVLAIAKLNKKGKVGSVNVFTGEFQGEGGLSNFVTWQQSEWMISTYSGKLFSVAIPSDLQDSTLQYIGPIGSRVERIDYYGDRDSIVAIESFTLEDDGLGVANPGSIIVGKVFNLQSQPNGSVIEALLPTASVLGKRVPAIRRPCNIKH